MATIITHDEAVKLHMGKLEEVKSLMSVIASDYKKTLESKTYRMRKGDVERVQRYIKDIHCQSRSLQDTVKQFKELL